MPYGLSDKITKEIISVLSSFEKIDEAILIGSRAKGNYKNGSDIDLALKGRELELNDVLKLQNLFSNLNTPYTFDILIYSQINNQDIIEHIKRVGIEFYKRK